MSSGSHAGAVRNEDGAGGGTDDRPRLLRGDRVVLRPLRVDDVRRVAEIQSGPEVVRFQYHEENEPDFRHASVDLFLAAHAQGQGLGTDAVRVLARYLIEERGHHRLTIDPAADNVAAIRAYEKVGFRSVGRMREYWRSPDGTWHDGLLMDLLARELSAP